VLISDVPQMVFELLRSEVESHDDMEVVGPHATRASLMDDISRTQPDVVILEPLPTRSREQCTRLLYSFPRAGAVVLAADQRDARLFELKLAETALGDMSPRELVGVIREQCLSVTAPTEPGA
jgi:DNA-binding NarL/FixJ family response regulator